MANIKINDQQWPNNLVTIDDSIFQIFGLCVCVSVAACSRFRIHTHLAQGAGYLAVLR